MLRNKLDTLQRNPVPVPALHNGDAVLPPAPVSENGHVAPTDEREEQLIEDLKPESAHLTVGEAFATCLKLSSRLLV